MKLTTYRRGTDHELFRFYTGLYDNADETAGTNLYSQTIRNASLRYPTKRECDCYFVVKHKDRVLINRYVNMRLAANQPRVRYIPAPDDESTKVYMKPQSMIVWPGMEVICYSRKFVKNSPITGAVYIVQDWDEKQKTITVKLHPDYIFEPIEDLMQIEPEEDESDSEDDEDVEELQATEEISYKLTFERAAQILRPQFALCYASIQGRTFRNKHIGLLDLHSRALTMRDIITATSRPTHGDYLHIISQQHIDALFSEARNVNDTDLRIAAER